MKRALAGLAIVTALAVACGGGNKPQTPTTPTPDPGPTNLTAPAPDTPVNNPQLDTLRPTLTVRNGSSTGSTAARVYEFQISDSSSFTTNVMSYIPGLAVLVTQAGVPEGSGGTTSFTPGTDLQPATRMFWRARFTQAGVTSAWSSTAEFRTKLVGFNRAGELYDPLIHSETIGTRIGSTTFLGARGLRVDNASSWVRYELASTLTSGEVSVDVEGLQPNGAGAKARIFSMMDGGPNLFLSKFLFNVQYRGVLGNPDNAISYKVVMGDADFKFEPDFAQRADGVRSLNPNTTYVWTATWGTSFRLTIREGSSTGAVIYDRSQQTQGVYNPTPHTVYLGANDAADESGSYAGAIYRNLWVGNRPRPASLGSAVR